MSRKKRGYDWEDKVTKIFEKNGWKAVRLGSPSIHLPDVLAVNDKRNTIVAVEAKAASGDKIYVPKDEIERLFRFLSIFGAYKHKAALIAVKFLKKKGKNMKESFYEVASVPERGLTFYRNRDEFPKEVAPWSFEPS